MESRQIKMNELLKLANVWLYFIIGQSLGDDFSWKKIHDSRQIDETIQGPYICDVGATDGVWTLGVELFIKNIVQFRTEIRINFWEMEGLWRRKER